MPLKYSCFISFRHGDRELPTDQNLLETIIRQLKTALSSELEAFTTKQVYVDWERLKGGDFYNEALSQALCESACMVMVYVPTYFDEHKPYCTREYKAMEKLESKRLPLLDAAGQLQHGLIIPIVFRGLKFLPIEIKNQRAYYDFQSFQLGSREMSRNPNFNSKIRQIAEYIYDRCRELEALPTDPYLECANFNLPDEAEVIDWIREVTQVRRAFPRL
jgi:TIR domain